MVKISLATVPGSKLPPRRPKSREAKVTKIQRRGQSSSFPAVPENKTFAEPEIKWSRSLEVDEKYEEALTNPNLNKPPNWMKLYLFPNDEPDGYITPYVPPEIENALREEGMEFHQENYRTRKQTINKVFYWCYVTHYQSGYRGDFGWIRCAGGGQWCFVVDDVGGKTREEIVEEGNEKKWKERIG